LLLFQQFAVHQGRTAKEAQLFGDVAREMPSSIPRRVYSKLVAPWSQQARRDRRAFTGVRPWCLDSAAGGGQVAETASLVPVSIAVFFSAPAEGRESIPL